MTLLNSLLSRRCGLALARSSRRFLTGGGGSVFLLPVVAWSFTVRKPHKASPASSVPYTNKNCTKHHATQVGDSCLAHKVADVLPTMIHTRVWNALFPSLTDHKHHHHHHQQQVFQKRIHNVSNTTTFRRQFPLTNKPLHRASARHGVTTTTNSDKNNRFLRLPCTRSCGSACASRPPFPAPCGRRRT